MPGPDGPEREGAPPKETPEKQIERAKRQAAERRATRDARARDARRELARSLRRWLRGGPMTDAVREELRAHARRKARLLRVQELAAAAGDIDTMKQVDRLLSRETSRHERTLREMGRPSRPPASTPKREEAGPDAGPPAPGAAATARANTTTKATAGP
jgi:hypothetical protein